MFGRRLKSKPSLRKYVHVPSFEVVADDSLVQLTNRYL